MVHAPQTENKQTRQRLSPQVVKANWYGFLSWMGDMEDVRLIDSNNYDGVTHYDLVGHWSGTGSWH
jgi:hypothetical protein